MRTRGNTLYACLVIAGVTGLLLASISGPTPFFGLERGGVGERTGLGAGTSLVLLSDNVSSPTVPITTLILPPTSSNGWYTGPVDVSMSVYDPGTAGTTTYYQLDTGAWTVYTGNFTISSDGVHTLNYYSIDSANNTEPTNVATIKIDSKPPTTSISITGTFDQGTLSYSSPVQIILSANDTVSGVAAIYYRLDTGNITTFSSPFSISSDGDHIVLFYSKDVAGNVEPVQEQTIAIQLVGPPTVIDASGVFGTNGWYTSNVTVSLNRSSVSNGSQYQVNGGDWTTYAGPFDLSMDGTYDIAARTIDQYGVWGMAASAIIKIDQNRPDLILYAKNGTSYPSGPITISWGGSGGASGIDHYEIVLDNGFPVNVSFSQTTVSYPNSLSLGTHTLSVIAVSGAGLSTVESVTFSVRNETAATAVAQSTMNIPFNLIGIAFFFIVLFITIIGYWRDYKKK